MKDFGLLIVSLSGIGANSLQVVKGFGILVNLVNVVIGLSIKVKNLLVIAGILVTGLSIKGLGLPIGLLVVKSLIIVILLRARDNLVIGPLIKCLGLEVHKGL